MLHLATVIRRLTAQNLILGLCAFFVTYDLYYLLSLHSFSAPTTEAPTSTSSSTNPTTIKVDRFQQALDTIPAEAVEGGKAVMKTHRAIFTGVASNNAAEIEQVLKHIVQTGNLFADYQVIIYEIDSTDKTVELVNQFAKTLGNNKVRIISKRSDPFSGSARVVLRNSFLTEVNHNPAYKDFDLVVVVNMNLKFGWDVRGLAHSFSKLPTWDVVSANGVFNRGFGMHMAELHSLRPNERTQADSGPLTGWLNPQMKEFETNRTGYWNWLGTKVNQVRFLPSRADPMVPVDSAVGGLVIYRRANTRDCFYSAKREDSEHVAFHECIRSNNGGRIFIDAKFLVKMANYNHDM